MSYEYLNDKFKKTLDCYFTGSDEEKQNFINNFTEYSKTDKLIKSLTGKNNVLYNAKIKDIIQDMSYYSLMNPV